MSRFWDEPAQIRMYRKNRKEFFMDSTEYDMEKAAFFGKPLPFQGFCAFITKYHHAYQLFNKIIISDLTTEQFYLKVRVRAKSWQTFKIVIKVIEANIQELTLLYSNLVSTKCGQLLVQFLRNYTAEIYYTFGYCPPKKYFNQIEVMEALEVYCLDLMEVPLDPSKVVHSQSDFLGFNTFTP
jgi:hypothetical protein